MSLFRRVVSAGIFEIDETCRKCGSYLLCSRPNGAIERIYGWYWQQWCPACKLEAQVAYPMNYDEFIEYWERPVGCGANSVDTKESGRLGWQVANIVSKEIFPNYEDGFAYLEHGDGKLEIRFHIRANEQRLFPPNAEPDLFAILPDKGMLVSTLSVEHRRCLPALANDLMPAIERYLEREKGWTSAQLRLFAA